MMMRIMVMMMMMIQEAGQGSEVRMLYGGTMSAWFGTYSLDK